jgi:hypothetical protein
MINLSTATISKAEGIKIFEIIWKVIILKTYNLI